MEHSKSFIQGIRYMFSRRTILITLASVSVINTGLTQETPEPAFYSATFSLDATPPVGSPLAYDPMTFVDYPLSCKGLVVWSESVAPVVICAVDWIGIGNDGHVAWRQALAEAAKTSPDRVQVHTLHQHDAPVCDFSANDILSEVGLHSSQFDAVFARKVIARAAEHLQAAMTLPQPVTHLGLGKAMVEKVASNRRILDENGKFRAQRWTACRDPELRAEPVGTIDPWIRVMSLWNGERPVAALSFYATHPQSYYRTGGANPDFPGLAREKMAAFTGSDGPRWIHLNGAGGDIGAGKWNDGEPDKRQILADRVFEGLKAAWNHTEKFPLNAEDLKFSQQEVHLPVASHLDQAPLLDILANPNAPQLSKNGAAANLAWLRRVNDQGAVSMSFGALKIGDSTTLFCPGELLVEYQLQAQQMAPNQWVNLAAYGDYGPGYICLEKHYFEGGYESSPRASRVAPSVEFSILPAFQKLLSDH